MRNTSNRSNAAQNNESKNQVNNRKSSNAPKQTPAPASDAPKGVKVEDLEARLKEYNSDLSKAKKQSQKSSENLTKVREQVENQRYVVAVQRANLGIANAEDLAIIASRKALENTNTGLAKFFAKVFEDSDEVAKARKEAREEDGSLASAIAETKRQWNTNGYAVLYGSIGMNKRSLDSIPNLLKAGLCPFLQVASADGLKAATVTRTAVRKNGKAVKVKGQRVYKYTLRERTKWSAYGLFETLERNYRMDGFFSEDELKVRLDLLKAEVAAKAALKKAQEDAKSDVPAVAAEAANREEKLAAAAKAAGKAVKENTANTTQHTTKGGEATKVA